jgi:hypothetical protein
VSLNEGCTFGSAYSSKCGIIILASQGEHALILLGVKSKHAKGGMRNEEAKASWLYAD